jgi:hypothetical protein
MASGLDLLGAISTSLSGQYITFHVNSVNTETLRQKLGGSKGKLATAGLRFVDAAPKAALDIASPYIISTMKDYGIEADVQLANKVPGERRAFSEFWPGLAMGVVVGGSGLLIWKAFAALVSKIAAR